MEIDPGVKILLDADIIIHFIKGDRIGTLHQIYPNELYLMDIVFSEVFKYTSQKSIVENMIKFGFIKEMNLDDAGEKVKHEYFRLNGSRGGYLGKGESAIMAYCRFNQDVLASSNLSDIKSYCRQHTITYLTTMDFLAEAFSKLIMSEDECDDFIRIVKSKGSKLIDGIDNIRNYQTR